MNSKRPNYAIAFFALMLPLAAASPARGAEQGAAGWINLTLRSPFAERYAFQLTVEPRFFENPNQLRILLIRPWFSATLSRGFAVALGYDGLFFFKAIEREEHRIWQQASHGYTGEHVRSMTRVRLEERFFSDINQVSVRGRFLIGMGVPLGRGIELVVKNEFFVNFNQVPVVGKQGYAENRLYGGFARKFAPWLGAAVGYQMQWVDAQVLDVINHTVVVTLIFETPTPKAGD